MIGWLKHHHKKIREIATGLVLWESWNFFNDFIFYTFAIAYWGLLYGGIIAFVFTSVVNAFVFWLYEYMHVDWLGAHALRELENEETKSSIGKLMTWLAKKKVNWWEKILSPIIFIGLLLPIDPVIVAIHYQKQHFQGLKWKDWGMFFVANAVANAWWLLKVGTVVEVALYVWRHFILGVLF